MDTSSYDLRSGASSVSLATFNDDNDEDIDFSMDEDEALADGLINKDSIWVTMLLPTAPICKIWPYVRT